MEMEKPLFFSTKIENQVVAKGKTDYCEGHLKMQVSRANQKKNKTKQDHCQMFGLDLQETRIVCDC